MDLVEPGSLSYTSSHTTHVVLSLESSSLAITVHATSKLPLVAYVNCLNSVIGNSVSVQGAPRSQRSVTNQSYGGFSSVAKICPNIRPTVFLRVCNISTDLAKQNIGLSLSVGNVTRYSLVRNPF